MPWGDIPAWVSSIAACVSAVSAGVAVVFIRQQKLAADAFLCDLAEENKRLAARDKAWTEQSAEWIALMDKLAPPNAS